MRWVRERAERALFGGLRPYKGVRMEECHNNYTVSFSFSHLSSLAFHFFPLPFSLSPFLLFLSLSLPPFSSFLSLSLPSLSLSLSLSLPTLPFSLSPSLLFLSLFHSPLFLSLPLPLSFSLLIFSLLLLLSLFLCSYVQTLPSLTKDFGRWVGFDGEGVVSLLLLLALKRRKPSDSRRLNFFILLSFSLLLRVTGGELGAANIYKQMQCCVSCAHDNDVMHLLSVHQFTTKDKKV